MDPQQRLTAAEACELEVFKERGKSPALNGKSGGFWKWYPEWMVYIMENPIFSWLKMDDLKVPHYQCAMGSVANCCTRVYRNMIWYDPIISYNLPVVPHKAAAEVSKMENL